VNVLLECDTARWRFTWGSAFQGLLGELNFEKLFLKIIFMKKLRKLNSNVTDSVQQSIVGYVGEEKIIVMVNQDRLKLLL